MKKVWEDQFRIWAKPPSQSEQDRCDNAVSAIRNAIKNSSQLNHRNIQVFSQGSYRNNTNVRQDSDVDVGILCFDSFFPYYPDGTTSSTFGNSSATYKYATFKNEVGQALIDHFSEGSVTRGNKAFDIKANSYHVEADVAPFFEHRRYNIGGKYLSGVELNPDSGQPSSVVNWPEQHYDNGVSKNKRTGTRYKSLVRILKSLRNEMIDDGVTAANPVPGFLLECLGWNVLDDQLGNTNYWDDVRNSLAFLYQNTLTHQTCNEWGEVSELKYLFRPQQKWTRQQANEFAEAAWNYVGF